MLEKQKMVRKEHTDTLTPYRQGPPQKGREKDLRDALNEIRGRR